MWRIFDFAFFARRRKMSEAAIEAAIETAKNCPESEKVPLRVGDRVIALESFTFWADRVPKGTRGVVTEYDGIGTMPIRIMWDSNKCNLWGKLGPIGKLVHRKKGSK